MVLWAGVKSSNSTLAANRGDHPGSTRAYTGKHTAERARNYTTSEDANCDREAMSFVATTAGITGEDVRDLMVAAVEHRFGPVNQLPRPIEWLTDNGSCYLARETRRFATDIGLVPRTTPLESPQSNGMAEAFVRTLKRDYVRVSPVPDAQSVLRQLPAWLAHYNELHPHRALGYRSPREFIARSTQEALSGL